MRRREFIALFGAAFVTRPGLAQTTMRKMPRIGILTAADSEQTPILQAFRKGLAELGYEDGRDVVLEFRLARGDYGDFPRLLSELIRLPVDVILVDGGSAATAAVAATKTIPIVMGTSGDPIASGFAASLARPGGNVTGFSLISTELNVKRLDLLRSAFPNARAMAVLFNPRKPTALMGVRAISAAAHGFGLILTAHEAQSVEALRGLNPRLFESGVPVLVVPDAMFWNNRQAIIDAVQGSGAPALYPEREYADSGGLMSYGPNVPDQFRRAASYVIRILKGEKPGDLSIQQPERFDFVVNLRAARALGVTIPQAILTSADEVIE